MAIQDYCIGLKGAVNAIHRVTRALSGNVNSTTISDAVEEVAIAIENGGGGGGGGTTDHAKLQNRDIADQHPIGAITGLETELNGKADASSTYTKSEVDSSLATKQEKLESGTNIKTINNTSLLGTGNIDVEGDAVVNASEFQDVYSVSIGNRTDGTAITFNETKSDGRVSGYLFTDTPFEMAKQGELEGLQSQIDALEAPIQTQDDWMYKIYADGTFDAWYKATGQSLTITATSGNLYRSEIQKIELPTNLTTGKTVTIQMVSPGVSHNNYPVWGILASMQETTFNYYALSGGSRTNSPNYIITAHVFGTIQ